MDDLISRQAAIAHAISGRTRELEGEKWIRVSEVRESLQTMPSAQSIDVQEAYYRGKIDGVKECTARLKKVNEEFANDRS